MIKIDTREPDKYIDFLRKSFTDMKFERATLKEGDYESDKVLAERKTIPDLYGSIVGNGQRPGRMIDQIERLSVHQDDKVVVLLVTGSIGDYISTMKAVNVYVDQNILYGEIASVACRYGIMPMWISNEWEALITLIKFMHKVDQGKYCVPSRRDPDILIAKLLGVTASQWKDLKTKHKSLANIATTPTNALTLIHGIGQIKAKRIKDVLCGDLSLR